MVAWIRSTVTRDPGSLERREIVQGDRSSVIASLMVADTKRNRLVVFSGGSAAVSLSFRFHSYMHSVLKYICGYPITMDSSLFGRSWNWLIISL